MTPPPPPAGSAMRRLDRLVLLARGAMLWEALWRVLVALLSAVALFVAAAWFGLLADRPPAVRIAAIALCLGLGVVVAWRAAGLARASAWWPGRREALARIDRDSHFTHGQASASTDSLANTGDPATGALWKLHQARLAESLRGARVDPPKPQLARVDRFAFRAGVVVLLAAAAVVAGDERGARLVSALDWGVTKPLTAAGLRIDAWIDPPAYTGKPPLVLNMAQAGDAPLVAPVGSIIVVRASDPAALTISTDGAIAPKETETAAKDQKPDPAKRFVLRGDGKLTLAGSGGPRSTFAISAIPDKPPTIELTAPPKPNARGSMTFGYRIGDDYGVVGAEAEFSAPEIDGKPVTGRTLVAPPRVGLALPVGQNGLGDATTTADLSDHPWAGARATMILHARDEGGNEGVSAPAGVQLPQRRFTKPLARALVEQRRNLVLDPDHRDRVGSALAGLMVAPDLFGTTPGVYLGLRFASQQLEAARTDPALVEVADYLWAMALQIEDGDLSASERDLRAAQKELRDALARGANEEEIRKLTENLRAAMDKFLNEMAERQARENAERGDEPGQRADRNTRMISRDDLKAMMDRIEEMARSGNLADAQRMLEQMQSVLENLRTAKRQRKNSRAQEMSRALDDLDALTRDQQALRDDTFRDDSQKQRRSKKSRKQNSPPGAQQPGGGDDQADESDDVDAGDDSASPSQRNLSERQKALRDKLGDLQRRLDRMRRKGDNTLGDAGDAMKEAEDALGDNDGEGQPGQDGKPQSGGRKGKERGMGQAGRETAVDAQGRALEALRKGAQNLAQQMQGQGQGQGEAQGDQDGDDAMADGDGNGDGEPMPGEPRQAEGGSRDPLGRPTSRDPLYNPRAKYDPMGASPALRAQRVLEELRRRLGDTSRPQDEIDYLERLLRRY